MNKKATDSAGFKSNVFIRLKKSLSRLQGPITDLFSGMGLKIAAPLKIAAQWKGVGIPPPGDHELLRCMRRTGRIR
ncbi:hypothetical protein JW906_07320 [bacterium]|nr:hypothetical protein [bacterium]